MANLGLKHASRSSPAGPSQPCFSPGPSLRDASHSMAVRRGDPKGPLSSVRLDYLCARKASLRSRPRRLHADGGPRRGPSSNTPLSKEEFLKMMLPDSPPGEEGRRKHALQVGGLSPRRSLYRTLSDESVCSNRKASSYGSSRSSVLEQALPNDILFSSTPPFHSTLPLRMSLNQGASNLRNEFCYSDGSLADRSKFGEPGLMPLPDTGSGLDWSHLVDAARVFEGLDLDEEAGPLDQRLASFCGMADIGQAQALSQELTRRVAAAEALEAGEEGSPGSLTGKVNQLELILRQLQYDLHKEKEDKAMLQEQVQHLRQDNMRLHEESQTAAAQLRKFTEWFFHSIDKKP
ncbi:hypothetical protein SKAU_G00147910 [Synaphobranchus kaupii]|uniref:Signal-induced proliferation-associated 1-like protein C-terminal domain-containing protein n=1 Tax=Synaphobranchus kaupii TaxID=118154 RepID=A0A9Q1J519_SYNKA|nr:hypothetical protein SKAU_G00147910 [Synaphobranchus kaupii]